MNYLGKALVLINLALGLIFMTWALVLFLSPVDWGRKEARTMWVTTPPDGKKEGNEHLAARIDERVAGYKKLREFRSLAVARARQAEKGLAQVNGRFGANHIVYAQVSDYLWQAPDKIVISDVKYNKDGSLALQPGGMPLLDQLVPEITKSYTSYRKDLFDKSQEMAKVSKQIEQAHAKQEKLTVRLNGVRGKDGKVAEPGYYDLLEAEAQAQKKLKEELEYQQPFWVYELYNASLLRERRKGLENRLRELGADPSAILPK